MELGGSGRSVGGILMEALELLQRCLTIGGGSVESYVALSGKRGLRWILPEEAGRLTGLLAAWQPYSIPAKAGWGLIRLAAKGGFLSRLPNVKNFEADLSSTDWRDFGWSQTEPPTVIAYVGTPGAHRKLVVILADPRDGTGRLVVKCPLVDTAWPQITHEFFTLKSLREEKRNIAPMALYINNEKRFTVQSYMLCFPTCLNICKEHYNFLEGLVQADRNILSQDIHTNLIEERQQLINNREILPKIKELTGKLLADSIWKGSIPAVRVHGDFVPWNIKKNNDGTLCALDWEYSEPIGLPYYDLSYYQTQVAHNLRRRIKIEWDTFIQGTTCTYGIQQTQARSAVIKMARVKALLKLSNQIHKNA